MSAALHDEVLHSRPKPPKFEYPDPDPDLGGESASAFYAGVELGTLPGLLLSAAVLAILAATGT